VKTSLQYEAPPATGTEFLRGLRTRAAANLRRVAFPETADTRTLAAVRVMAADRIVEPVLVLDREFPASYPAARATAAEIGARVVECGAGGALATAMNLLKAGEVDATVAGAAHTTASVVRAALRFVKPAKGVRTVSSAFYMVLRDDGPQGTDSVLTFTDCSVVPEPTTEQLVEIALAAAAARVQVVGDEPRIAFLSFSTHGSGGEAAASIARARVAAEMVRAESPGLLVDGDLQVDAALVPAVAALKDGGPLGGRANVLVFPSLDAGNIAYKLVERLAGATAIGPILQGLARPCSDLSRGAGPDDIINAAVVTAIQEAASRSSL
jgi:phosphate acetyltransferase